MLTGVLVGNNKSNSEELNMSLKDKVAIVTGSSSGIGAAIALKFAEEGAKVVIVGRNQKKMAAVEKKVEKHGNKPLVIAADVSIDDDARRIINDTIKHFGKLDILVNNAGFGRMANILDADCMEKFDDVMKTNLRAAVFLTHLAAPHLIKTKGNIINISSATSTSTYEIFEYPTSKAALDHFTRCVALELAEKGVRVNCINPGPVKTDFLEDMDPDYAKRTFELIVKTTALNRAGDPEEIGDLAAFVASHRGRSITGSCLVSDNGYLLKK